MTTQLYDLLDRSQQHDIQKHDWKALPQELALDADARLNVPSPYGLGPAPMALSDLALSHLCAKLGPAVFGKGSDKTLPRNYLAAVDPALRATNLNTALRRASNGNWTVRGYGDTCRAVLAGDYPDIRNTELIQALADVVDRESLPEFQVCYRSTVDADHLNLRAVFKNVDPERGYGAGIYLGNSEVGQGKVKVFGMIWRDGCTNAAIIDDENGLAMIHMGSRAAMMVQVLGAIGRILPVAAEYVDKLILAEGQAMPSISDVIGGLAVKHKWTDDFKMHVLLGTEGQETLAGLVNGVTFAAHTAIQGDESATTEWEIFGGRLLVAPDSLFAEAARLSRRIRAGLEAE